MKRRRGLLFLPLMLILALAAFRPTAAAAATMAVTGGTNGPLCNSGGYFLPATVTVASGDTVTFSVPANDPYAGGIQINGFPQGSFVVARGGSVTTNALTTSVNYQGTWPNSPGCIKGSGSVTVQAASSPTTPPSNSTLTPPSTSGTSNSGTYSVKTNSAPVKSTPTPASVQPAPPETVVADTITVAGKKVTSIEDLTINQSQLIVLSGKTVPNGHIVLTIHSNPTTASVQADASGNWSYAIKGLQPGEHSVDAIVTDPTTNQTSASSKLLSFTIKAAPTTPLAQSPPAKKKASLFAPLAVSALLLAIAIAVVIKMRNRDRAQAKDAGVGSPLEVNNNANERHKEDNL